MESLCLIKKNVNAQGWLIVINVINQGNMQNNAKKPNWEKKEEFKKFINKKNKQNKLFSFKPQYKQ